jgi:hypothetical protein
MKEQAIKSRLSSSIFSSPQSNPDVLPKPPLTEAFLSYQKHPKLKMSLRESAIGLHQKRIQNNFIG